MYVAIPFAFVLCGVLGALVMRRKGRSVWAGFFLGLLLGLIGVLISLAIYKSPAKIAAEEAALAPTHRECPWCAEMMEREASACPYCGRESPAWREHEGRWWMQSSGGGWFWRDEQAGRWIQPDAGMSTPAPA